MSVINTGRVNYDDADYMTRIIPRMIMVRKFVRHMQLVYSLENPGKVMMMLMIAIRVINMIN